MSCINSELIQKYVDGEASKKEIERIERHISNCRECATRIDQQIAFSDSVKKAIILLGEKPSESLPIVIPERQISRFNISPKKILYAVTAASILAFGILLMNKKEDAVQPEIAIMPDILPDYDANQPVSSQPLTDIMIDSDGNITEYFDQ